MAGKAYRVTDVELPPDTAGEWQLFRMEPPVAYSRYDSESDSEVTRHTDHVIVSAATVLPTGPETYIFPADASGNVLDWLELDGSFRGALDHDRAIRGAGYEIIERSCMS